MSARRHHGKRRICGSIEASCCTSPPLASAYVSAPWQALEPGLWKAPWQALDTAPRQALRQALW